MDKLLSQEIASVPADFSNGTYQALVDGAAADTDIDVTAADGTKIRLNDRIIGVIEFAATSNDPTDRTAVASVTSNDHIQLTVATTGDKLLVTWEARSRA